MVIRPLIWLALLAACKRTPAEEAPPPASAPTPAPRPVPDAAAPPDAAVTADAAGVGFSTTIRNDGVGPFHSGVVGTVDAIGKLVPGLQISIEKEEGEDHDIDTVTVAHAKRPVLQLVFDNYRDGKLVRIDILDPLFATVSGIGVGSTIGELAAKHPKVTCTFAKYDASLDVQHVDRRLYCETPGLPQVSFELDPAKWRAVGKLKVDQLRTRAIEKIVWLASQ